jgi:hypothetical protein
MATNLHRLGKMASMVRVAVLIAVLLALGPACKREASAMPEEGPVPKGGTLQDSGTGSGAEGGEGSQRDTNLSPDACFHGGPCQPHGSVCLANGTRCFCDDGAGKGAWYCEPARCPQDVLAGDPCSEDALYCGKRHEIWGHVCVAPENIFVDCNRVSAPEGLPLDWWCPPKIKAGAPCCVLDFSFIDDDCATKSGTFKCVANHWAKIR